MEAEFDVDGDSIVGSLGTITVHQLLIPVNWSFREQSFGTYLLLLTCEADVAAHLRLQT